MVKPYSCPEDKVVDTAGAGGKWFILSGEIPLIGEVSRGHSKEV